MGLKSCPFAIFSSCSSAAEKLQTAGLWL